MDGSDIGNNFFLEPTSLGKPRAEEVAKYLLELNSDVKGEAIVQVSLAVLLLCDPYPRSPCRADLGFPLPRRSGSLDRPLHLA